MTRVFVTSLGQSVDLKFLKVYRRRGKTFVYFRRKGMPEHRLDPQASDFMINYEKLLGDIVRIHRGGEAGTIDDLVSKYKTSPEFMGLKSKTKAQYNRHLDALRNLVGSMQAAEMPKQFLYELRDQRSATPAEANGFVRSIKRLYNWANKRGYLAVNPISSVELLRATGGYLPWEEHEVERFQSCWMLGSRERTMFELQLWTAQRRSDIVRMKWDHLRDDFISVASQVKTGERVEIPVSHPLREALDAWRSTSTGDYILVGQKGGALGERYYSEIFEAARNEAGIDPEKKGHGLRFTAARRLLDVGIPNDIIAMVTGHRTTQMVQRYAYRQRQTRFAINTIENANSRRQKQ